MKYTLVSTTLFLAVALVGSAAETPKTPSRSKDFERMKSLVGTWTGKCDMGDGPVDMTIRYRLVAAGSVIEERVMEGTPNEMITMYFDDKDGKLALTHYCMMGNRPAMKVAASDADSITFDFDASRCSIDPEKESHMRGMVVRFQDPDTITSSCKAVIDGKEMPENPMTLKRVK